MIVSLKVAAALFAIYALAMLGFYFGQRALMYHPDRTRVDPRSIGLAGVAERILETSDGERLIAWHLSAKPGQPTLLYFHGNAGNLSDRAARIAMFAGKGWGLFMLSYRSFGGSSGSPSEQANLADAELCLRTLQAEGVTAGDLILYGESLGTGVAVQLAASFPTAGLILDAPFTSMVDLAARHYPWVLVRPFLRDRYDSAAVIGRVKVPILILHGEQDYIVPTDMGREMARLAGRRAKLVTFPNGNHSDLYDHGALDAIAQFIAGLRE